MMQDRDGVSAPGSASSSTAGGGVPQVDSTVVGEDPLPSPTSRKGRSKNKEKPRKPRFLSTSSKSLSAIPSRIQLSMLSSGLIHITEEDKAIGAIPTKPIESKELNRICSQHRRFPVLYKVEFQMASKVEPHSMRHALKEANELKNTTKRSIPYDYNRVVLEPLPDSPDSDYVNASYIDSLLTPKAYIATQGPLENTIADFWRLAWQQKTRLIVMLTKTFDFIKVMCVQYWPAMVGCSDRYEGIKVDLLKEEQLANFVIRTIRLSLENHPEEEREIVQFHYTEWPSHTQPFINGLLEYRRRVRIWMKYNLTPADGPTIVHCSDGGARTGVYLAVDSNLELHEEDGKLDVYGYVKRMKQARPGLIETVNQYRCVYDALEEFLLCGYSFFPVSELSQRLKYKSMKLAGNKSEYQIEFEPHHKEDQLLP